MLNIPINSPLGYAGILALVFGFFLILSGLDIVNIDKITVTRGSKTWGFGAVLAVLGFLFLLPDLNNGFTARAALIQQSPVGQTNVATLPVTETTVPAIIAVKAAQDQSILNGRATPLLRAPTFTTAQSGATYRIGQEGITSGMRRAQVTECLVTLQIDGKVRFVVDDAASASSSGLLPPAHTVVGVLPLGTETEGVWSTYTIAPSTTPSPSGGARVNVELPLNDIAQKLLRAGNGQISLTLARWRCG
jgi:hypothetical protein